MLGLLPLLLALLRASAVTSAATSAATSYSSTSAVASAEAPSSATGLTGSGSNSNSYPDCTSWRTYNVGVLMASRLDSPFDLERCGPAVDLALEVVNEVYVRRHCVRLNKVHKSYPSCSGAVAPGLAADLHFQQNAIAFIGPACAFALEPVARLAAYWNTPIITGMGDQPPSEGELSVTSGILSRHLKARNGTSVRGMFQNKSAYPTLTRMSYCQCRLIQVFAAIFHQFAWRHVALILDKSDLFSLTVGKNLEHGLRKAGLLKYVRELDGNDEDGIEGYLNDASMYARVVILSVRGVLKRRFMLTAHTMGMTKGDWTFLDVDIFHGSFWGDRGWAWGEPTDLEAREAYEALLRVSLLVPTSRGFTEFAERVRLRAAEHYNYNFSADEEVNFFIGAFYDGVVLLGMALNETLVEGGDIMDGVAVTRRMWNREFEGITGHVRIDDSGDRDADYSVLDLDPVTGRFEEVAHYSGLTKNYTPLAGKQIHWPGGSKGPPPDVPPCGFMGSDPHCLAMEPSLLLTSAVLAVLLLLAAGVTAACVAYRRVKEAADLHNMSWRVRPEEVLLEVGKTFSSRLGLQKNSEMFEPGLERLHCRRCSAESGASLPPAQVFTTIGIYKGSRVAIKKITKTRVDITKKLLWEVKQVRDIVHENTVRFVGACVQAPAVIILTEYCPKGSLRDVLENDALKLDWNLRMSLIHDLVKGMVHLHSCELGAHGKLRSGNCLIDSRFVLKVSDFGLATLTAPSEVVKDQAYYTKLLWIAPELLPVTEVPGTPSSQKGDVYSFGIILEEIVTRAGPFEQARQLLSPQEVVARVRARESPPLRPVVSAGRDCPEALLDLMERCWADASDDRPSFENIRSEVRRIMKGYCENLMDDLLRRMEQYATNLEALVEEKTAQLSQEKRRSEELLYQVLPRPVAQQLMAGEMVRPEQFECVTVYFSDIVGFTALCAESTPIQVVDFLNDLYSTFDRIIGAYDVYKVETIGDAYMVVSGLPERNGDNHVREIALMALAILDAVRTFQIQHRPDQQLAVRIGVHSGPVCAGVVGQKMPHLCLFGDTVNTASRMESTGQPQRIHVSDAARLLLDRLGSFRLEERGLVELKGKGRVRTHWLLGCSAPDPRSAAALAQLAQLAAPADGAGSCQACGTCGAGEAASQDNPYPLLFPALSSSK